MIHQLRIYEISAEHRQEFHDRFRDHAQRIMKQYNFDIITMWESEIEDRVEFVYVLRWSDELALQVGWDAFMADEEWKAIKRRTSETTGQVVIGIVRDQVLRTVDYATEL